MSVCLRCPPSGALSVACKHGCSPWQSVTSAPGAACVPVSPDAETVSPGPLSVIVRMGQRPLATSCIDHQSLPAPLVCLFVAFLTMTFSEMIDQFFCRLSLSLGLSHPLPWDSGSVTLAAVIPDVVRGRPSERTSVTCAESSHFGGALMRGPIWDLLSPSPGIILSPSVPGSLWGSGLLSTQAPDPESAVPSPMGLGLPHLGVSCRMSSPPG